MASNIQAFVSIPSLANNNPDAVAVIGELSTDARTYAIDKQYVAADAQPGIELVIFSATTNNVKRSNVDAAFCAPALTLIKKIKDSYDGTIPLTQFITANVDSKFSAVTVSNTVLQSGVNLPRAMKFTHSDNGTVAFELWFANADFMKEYEGTEIKVVPPCFPVLGLYSTYEVAKKAVDDTTFLTLVEQEEKTRNNAPYTNKTVYQLKWNDPSDLTKQFTTNWVILGYGKQSTRTDLVLKAIREYLVANSTFTVDEWKRYLPDIKTIDTFVLIPRWDRVALTAGPGLDSLYNPIVRHKTMADKVTLISPDRTSDEVNNFLEYFTILYRNLGILAISGNGNADGRLYFGAMFPDYTVIDFNDNNINRLSARTQSIIRTVELLARAAEIDDGSRALPTGITRNMISGVVFLEKADDQIVYRMVTRTSYLAKVGA